MGIGGNSSVNERLVGFTQTVEHKEDINLYNSGSGD